MTFNLIDPFIFYMSSYSNKKRKKCANTTEIFAQLFIVTLRRAKLPNSYSVFLR